MNRVQSLLDRLAHPDESGMQRSRRRLQEAEQRVRDAEMPRVAMARPADAFPPELRAALDAAVMARKAGEPKPRVFAIPLGGGFPDNLSPDEERLLEVYRLMIAQAHVEEPRDFLFVAVPLASSVSQQLSDEARMEITVAAAKAADDRLWQMIDAQGGAKH